MKLLLAVLQLLLVLPVVTATAEGVLVDKVWSGHPVGFALLTERGYQFIAYYDSERRLTVISRKFPVDDWTRVQPSGVPVPNRGRMSNITGWDSHNGLKLALDRDGCLHLSGNMHGDPLVYYRTQKPYDLTTLQRIDRMTGDRELRCTYPAFFKNAKGDLCFRYRDGGSGNGSEFFNIYDEKSKSWRRLFDTPLFEGEGLRSAYASGPTLGPDGRYHVIWMWRDTPDAASNHTLSYARSRDLVQWESSSGAPIDLPIKFATGEVVDPAKPGEGLINMGYVLGFDANQRPIAAYHRYDSNGNSQIFVARPDAAGKWHASQLSDWQFRWNFSGGGSLPAEVRATGVRLDPDGSLLVDYWTKAVGSGTWRLNADTLALLERHKPSSKPAGKALPTPPAPAPGMQLQSATSVADGVRWTLRWYTLGPNRDRAQKIIPAPSELRLYRSPVE